MRCYGRLGIESRSGRCLSAVNSPSFQSTLFLTHRGFIVAGEHFTPPPGTGKILAYPAQSIRSVLGDVVDTTPRPCSRGVTTILLHNLEKSKFAMKNKTKRLLSHPSTPTQTLWPKHTRKGSRSSPLSIQPPTKEPGSPSLQTVRE